MRSRYTRSHPDRSSTPLRRRLALGSLAGAAALALALGGLAPAQAAPSVAAAPGKAKGQTVEINLATVNDFHGRIEQSGTAGGIARLSTAVNQLRKENPNTIFAAAGDMIGASTFTSFIQQDVPTIEALNAAGLDVSSVGNHEFDRGFADLTDRVMPLAAWEYLGANVYLKDTTEPALPEYWIAKVSGVSVGFVGAVTDELPSLVSPAGIEEISVGSPVEAANRVADQLSDGVKGNGEADIVIMLVHEGAATTDIASATDPNSPFGEIVLGANDNIDAIVSGHTHLAYNHVLPYGGDTGLRPVISSGQYGERFSNMVISYDRKVKSIISMENTIYTMAVARDENGNVTQWYAEPDKKVVPIVEEASALAAELGSVVLGDATALFGRAVFADPVGAESFPENRGGESTLGNFVADVQKWSLNSDQPRGVEITFMNPGGLRADLARGEVTYAEAAAVQPFANTLASMTMTGAQIKAVLEQQWQRDAFNALPSSRPFLRLAVSDGFRYIYTQQLVTEVMLDNPATPANEAGMTYEAQKGTVTGMWLNGVAIDPALSYVVGMNSFLASGGDNFRVFRQGTNKADSGKIDLESMVDWFEEFGTATPDITQRAVGVNLPGGTTVAAGSAVTVNLFSLDFTRDEIDADFAVVSFDGVELGRTAVDTSYTPATDDVGRASVTFTVPEDAIGPTTFAVTVPSTETTTTFTLDVTLDVTP
ncbi:MAG: bifunctional UDP-sugar hydrolase/5'-nucleotidase [Mycetocola sp.]